MSESLKDQWRAHAAEAGHLSGTLPPDTSKGYAWCPVAGCLWNARDSERVAGLSAHRETVKYVGHKEFERDQANWLKKGYRVESIDEVHQPPGVARIAAIGLGALVVKPKSHFYVTYSRD